MKQLRVLQRRPLRDNSALLRVLTQDDELLWLDCPASVMARPEVFQWLEGDWLIRGDWLQIRLASTRQSPALNGEWLYCGLYLNELLTRLAPLQEAVPGLFVLYQQTLGALHDQQRPEPWLRHFEFQLLTRLGLGFHWHLDHRGEAIEMDRHYRFEAQTGFQRAADGWSGSVLLAIAAGELNQPHSLSACREIMRQALDAQIGRDLVSRRLFQPPDHLATIR